MPVEMRMWRIGGERPRPLGATVLPTKAALEDFLEQDPSLLGTPPLVIGRQVRTPHGKLIDLVSIDADGNLHVLELGVLNVVDPNSCKRRFYAPRVLDVLAAGGA